MRHLGVFAKYWRPGAVKTRLAAEVGAKPASELYRGFLATLLRRLRAVADTRTIVFTPRERRREFEHLAGASWRVAPQLDGDLGRRMADFFAAAFAEGAGQVVLIGSDSPNVPAALIDVAFARLRSVPVVLGPARDGGYYLIGAAERVPPVFAGVAWSSPNVWQQTVQRLEDAHCPFAQLPEWYDVDDLAGLRRLHRDLTSDPCRDEALSDLFEMMANTLDRLC
jgi:rSAM/selenodomain-associated transferase 1